MGLDSAWVLKAENTAHLKLHFKPELELCGGMFSEHGNGSFRGKVYAALVEEVTGVSLYQEEIPNAVVRAMAEKLAAVDPVWASEEFGTPVDQVADLQRMFLAYGEAGADLIGWW